MHPTAAAVAKALGALERYQDSSGDSGVSAYASGPDFLLVVFRDDAVYLYNHAKPGRAHVAQMKTLAARGDGLATYINQHVRDHYAAKLR